MTNRTLQRVATCAVALATMATAIYLNNAADNLDNATMKVVVSEKREALPIAKEYLCTAEECVRQLRSMPANSSVYLYSFKTTIDGELCTDSVKVKSVRHKCVMGQEFVSKEKWDQMKLGDVLKVTKF